MTKNTNYYTHIVYYSEAARQGKQRRQERQVTIHDMEHGTFPSQQTALAVQPTLYPFPPLARFPLLLRCPPLLSLSLFFLHYAPKFDHTNQVLHIPPQLYQHPPFELPILNTTTFLFFFFSFFFTLNLFFNDNDSFFPSRDRDLATLSPCTLTNHHTNRIS